MLSIAVCDDEVIECCNMAKRIKEIMEEMKIPCIIRQFRSGGELLQALESFDIVFLDIIMRDLDGMKTAQIFRKRMSSITVFDVASWGASNGIMVRSGGSMSLYYDQIFSHAEFLILALLSMSAVGFYVFGMNRIYLEQEKSGRYHSQIAVYKMLAEQYRQSERLRHDMKNHIIVLSALSHNKEWEKIDGYLRNMEGIALDAGGDMTGNKAVDALLYQKRRRAKEENIKWECDVQMPKGCCINEFDLCVLFGNILDNALEACQRLQCDEYSFINIQARTVKKCFLLEVKNSMDRTEKYAEGFTNKDNSQEHGIGLLNVSDVVNKYNGVVNIETKKGTFVISVLMPLNNAAHDVKTAV